MGLFDKKKKSKDDFDSPVEQIDLSAPSTASGSLPKDDDDYEEVVASPAPAAAASKAASLPLKAPAATAAAPAAAPVRKAVTSSGYGIDDAISLMRTLPSDNVELVVQVVKHTLESAHIDIATIIDDATGKVDRIESRVTVLRSAIADLEREIQTRRDEIDKLEADRRETTRVKERLLLAQKLTTEKRERPGSNSSYPTPQPMTGTGPTAAAAESSGPLPGLNAARAPRTTGEVAAARERPLTMQPPAGAGTDATAPKK
ncbi:MAG TPA: hypothetical protein VMZ28_00245 [Kofleriaceae bacterium]|nr:hypothetical protein [Kofleriaceae bacterium]